MSMKSWCLLRKLYWLDKHSCKSGLITWRVNNSSKEGVVSSIESVRDCVGNVCIETEFVSFAEKRVETVVVSSWAVTRPGWAAVQYLCQNCRVKHIVQWWGWHSVCSQNFEHVQCVFVCVALFDLWHVTAFTAVFVISVRYALYLLDNENLLDIWDLETHRNLTIRNGIIFFHLNRKLCLYKIYDFRRAVGMDGQVGEPDISSTNNGDQVACKLHKCPVFELFPFPVLNLRSSCIE